jgi:L,D-transpeptidase ErfK/SrfK
MLFHFEDWRVTGAYPVAIGPPSKQWRTPIGSFKVIQMREDPTWRVPASIQREEEAEGKAVEDEVEPGPDNPLGKYWIGLSLPIVGIHGTNHPMTVYSYRTHGCVRLHPDDIEALFEAVNLNDRGEIVYLPLRRARLDDGRIFLESQKDIYRKGTGGIAAVRALAERTGIGSLIDWPRAENVVRDEDGIARDVTSKSIRAGGTPDSNAATTSEQKPAAGKQPPANQPSANQLSVESISTTLPAH